MRRLAGRGKQSVSLVSTVLGVVAPVFLLAAVGYGWVRLRIPYDVAFVTRLSMTLGVPCLIFVALMHTRIEPAALSALLLAAVTAYGILTLSVLGLAAAAGLDRRTYVAPLIFGNTGNLGLPIALFAFGAEGFGYAVVVFAVMAVWSFTFGVWLVSGGGGLGRVVREPMVWATLGGAVFLWQGWQTPDWITRALELIGQMAIPLMLITLGVAVARLTPGRLGRAAWLSALRVAACIAVAAAVGHWFGLAPVPLGVLVVQISTPVAVTSYMMAAKYGADADAVAGLVVVSTLMSVVALPITLAFLV